MNFELNSMEILIRQKMKALSAGEDPAHDFLHLDRVVQMAKKLSHLERARSEVVVPAAWLHDFVLIAKDDPRRKQASTLSAQAALVFLREIGYPEVYFDDIAHAIRAHSFSANLSADTLEAKIVQDADRLDGLGAIGVARCFATAGLLKRPFYAAADAFCKERKPDDSQFTVDHFFAKLFLTADTLKTASGREEGIRRAQFMKTYLEALRLEI